MSNCSSQLKHYALQASAGAGKTSRLIQEMLTVIQSHPKNSCPRLIATTFTKKAAQEIKERIMQTTVDQKNWTLLNALFDPSKILISTLHSILYSFLQKHIFTHSSYEFANSYQIQSLSRSIARDLFFAHPKYFTLFKYYTFQDLCQMLIEYDQNTRQTPEFQPLDIQDIQKDWIDYIHNIASHPAMPEDIQRLIKNRDPLKITDQDVQQWTVKQNPEVQDMFKKLKENIKKNHPQYASELSKYYQLFTKLADQFKIQWQEQKQKKNYIQMEDLELLALESIQKQPSCVSAFSKEWDYWFIDEYQDISPIQEQLLKNLTQHSKNIWTVGDPQQSIYLFRKADPQVFQRRKQQVQKCGKWEENFHNHRADPELIAFFNDFFQKPFTKMELSQPLSNPLKNPAHFLTYSEPCSLNDIIAYRINEILKNQDKEISVPTICILTKTNDEVKNIFHFLKKLKFPVQMHSAQTLKREIIDLLFLLRFLISPSDNINLVGLLRTPFFYLSDSLIADHSKKNQCLWAVLKKNLQTHPVVKSLTTLLNKSYEIGLSETLVLFLEKHFMVDLSFYQDPTGDYEYQIWKFLSNLKNKEKTPGFQHSRYVEELMRQTRFYSLDSQNQSTGSMQSGFIQVMTIHQSKGLEFDYVIIPYIDKSLKISDTRRFYFNSHKKFWSFSIQNQKGESICPRQQTLWKKKESDQKMQEQDRVLYVAMTRAKKNITFIYSHTALKKNITENWLNRFSYFSKIHSKNKKTLSFQDYSIEVNNISELAQQPICRLKQSLSQKPLSPYKHSSPKLMKKNIQISKKTIPCNIHSVAGSVKGRRLHHTMQFLSRSQNHEPLLNTLSSAEEKKAIQYILSLKEPPIKQLFKNNLKTPSSEWSFIFEQESYLIEGRIDFWGEVNNEIWVIDYKSSSKKLSEDVWRQLGIYAFVLKKHKPKKNIFISAIQPFIQNTEIKPFTPALFKQIEDSLLKELS